jgi:Hyaluronidase protein (HylP)
VASTHDEYAARTRRSLIARAGLVAGGVGVAVLRGPEPARAQTVGETVEVAPPAGDAALRLMPSGAVEPSASVGGAMNLDNSGSTGAGAVLYSNRGADAVGRLLVVNQDNPANPQHAFRVENSGIAHTVSIYHDPAGGAGDPTAEAIDVVSTNPLDTTVGVRGREEGKGTVKVTHEKPAGPDANASAISIALLGQGTACQGIYIGNDAGHQTTGPLLHIRNGGAGAERLVLTADGRMELPVTGSAGGLVIGTDANLYRSAPKVLATSGGLEARTVIAHASVTLSSKAANPPPPLPGTQARMYVKGAKLVLQWNDGLKTLYTTIQLDDPGPYPVTPKVTTDTNPP